MLLPNQDKWKKDALNMVQPEDKWKPKAFNSGGTQMLDDKWRVSEGGRPEWPLDANWRASSGTVNPLYLGNIPSPALATPPSWFSNLKPGEKDFRFDGFSRDDFISREGLSRESSRDDINSVCDQQFEYEERFRVDRRKLELMIIGSGDSQLGEAAAAFFEKISRETDTTIIWPSRLKIGAKSKKDPHIRVGGQEEGVKLAKARITEVLDTRVNSRVTIKMDVSYTDHSHIIGKGGNTIRRVMTDTNTHIHFPDSNRSNPNEKSNQVSIAGEMGMVERARARVRELTPLIFQFDLAIVPSFHTIPDQSNSYLRAIQDQYNVQVSFRQKQKNFHTVTVVIKGCELEASRVKEATLLLMDHLWPNNVTVSSVNMTMEISPGHHAVVVGKGSINLRVIMQRTNTVIIFPDAGDPNIPPIRKGSVTISGAIHNVYLARQLLLGSLPIVMMFDVPDSIDIDEPMIQKLQAENEVTITIKPKARQSNKSCIIKTQERNVGGMYVARHKLLDLEGDVVKAEIPETYKVPLVGSSSNFHMASLPANRGPFLCPTGAGNPHLQSLGSPLSPNFIPSPASVYNPLTPTMPPGSPWAFPTAGTPHSLPIPASADYSRLSPTQYQLQEYMLLNALKHQQQEAEKKLHMHQQHQHHIKQLQQHQIQQHQLAQLQHHHQFQKHQQQQHLQHQQAMQQQKQREEIQHQLEMEKKKWCSPPNVSKIGPSGSDLGSSMQSSPHHSPRNSSPVNAAGNLTNNLHKMDLTGCSSGIEANPDISAIMADIDLSDTDRRAPGCEKKVAESVDYEQKRMRANQAVLRNPVEGEERKPCSDWVGLGFSSSMPAEAILKNIDSSCEESKEKQAEKANTTWLTNLKDIKEVPEEKLDDLGNVLLNNGLSKFTDVFRRHEIDLTTFKELTEEELKEIGINTFGPRKKLMMLADKLRSA
jgi:protein bicaudal C